MARILATVKVAAGALGEKRRELVHLGETLDYRRVDRRTLPQETEEKQTVACKGPDSRKLSKESVSRRGKMVLVPGVVTSLSLSSAFSLSTG